LDRSEDPLFYSYTNFYVYLSPVTAFHESWYTAVEL